MKKTFIFLITLNIFYTQPAFAYLDPGTGSALISMIIGLFVSIGVIIKTFWYRIKSFFDISENNKKDTKKRLK